MSALAFDTHAFVKRLTAAGMPEQQAEVLADQQASLINEKLATKNDIALVREDLARTEATLRAEIAKVDAGLKADLARIDTGLRADLAKIDTGFKADLARIDTGFKADLARIQAELRRDIEAAKSETTRWMFGTIGFQTLVIIGAVIALARMVHP